jgi:hypothetical protein
LAHCFRAHIGVVSAAAAIGPQEAERAPSGHELAGIAVLMLPTCRTSPVILIADKSRAAAWSSAASRLSWSRTTSPLSESSTSNLRHKAPEEGGGV